MMRKIFGGTMLLSITGAIILGGAFAWNGSKTSGEQTFHLGAVDWALHYESENGVVGPNDGTTVQPIGDGYIDNLGDFPLKITSGAIRIDDSNGAPLMCASAAYYNGSVDPLGGPNDMLAPHTYGNPIGGPDDAGITAGQFATTMMVMSSLPDSCMGQTISYTVRIDVTTNAQ